MKPALEAWRMDKGLSLKVGGLVYGIAYGWSHAHFEPPTSTNLCRLFWRCALSLAIMWPLVAIGFAIGFPFAARPAIFRADCAEGPLVGYAHWPRVAGKRITPLSVLFLLALGYGVYGVLRAWGAEIGFLTLMALAVVILVAAAFSAIHALRWAARLTGPLMLRAVDRLADAEVIELAAAYIAAKKQRVCPTIRLVESE